MTLPELSTDRLHLRGHRLDDSPACAALWREAGAIPRFEGGPPSPEAVWSRLLRASGHWVQLGYGPWIVTCRATGRVLGEAGLLSLERDLSIPTPDAPEVFWRLSPAAQREGLVRETMLAVLEWADRRLSAPQSFALFDPEDAAGQALAAELGFEDLRPARYRGGPVMMMTRPKRRSAV